MNSGMIQIVKTPISSEAVVNSLKVPANGCLLAYVGFIRDFSHGKPVLSVEYADVDGRGEDRLREIVRELENKWSLNGVAICHRVGKLQVGDNNLVVAVAAAHRGEAFAACQYAIDLFKEKSPTRKKETYLE